jgi:hypothetical protein
MTSTPAGIIDKGNINVLKSLLNKKMAVVVVATAAVLGGGVAYAYPPGTALSVGATASPDSANPGHTKVPVTVSAANPTCSTLIKVDGGHDVTLPPGTTTTTIDLASGGAGRHSVTARTVGCKKGSKEHAKSKFVTLDAKATGGATSPVKKNYEVNISGLEPGTHVTVVATLAGGSVVLTKPDTADRRGNAKVKFKFKVAGTYSIVTTVDGGGTPVNSVTVVVG